MLLVLHSCACQGCVCVSVLCVCVLEEVGGVTGPDAALPLPAAGRSDPADPVLPRLPQDPEPADVPQPGRAL